jgi:hypothetical protein
MIFARLNSDLGEFVSTIYSRKSNAQKAKAWQLAIVLKTVANIGGGGPQSRSWVGSEARLLEAVKTFLTSLSYVMLNQAQHELVPPEPHSETRDDAAWLASSHLAQDVVPRDAQHLVRAVRPGRGGIRGVSGAVPAVMRDVPAGRCLRCDSVLRAAGGRMDVAVGGCGGWGWDEGYG